MAVVPINFVMDEIKEAQKHDLSIQQMLVEWQQQPGAHGSV